MLSLIWYIFLPTNSQLMLRYVLLTYWFPIHHAVDLNTTLISFANNFRNIGHLTVKFDQVIPSSSASIFRFPFLYYARYFMTHTFLHKKIFFSCSTLIWIFHVNNALKLRTCFSRKSYLP